MVIAPANTGSDKISKADVIIIDQMNKGVLVIFIPVVRITKKVVIKLIDLKIEETPPKCKEKIDRSTERSLWNLSVDKGG